MAAAVPAIMITGALVLPELVVGMINGRYPSWGKSNAHHACPQPRVDRCCPASLR
jgi:hypothetical protein